MISFVNGELAAVEKDMAVVNVGGIGYGVYMSQQAMTQLPRAGHVVKLYTYLNVRGDALQLFGFLKKEDLDIFKLLIGVNGIGPKVGLGILSHLSADDLRFAVASGDVKAISAAPGMGKKTAEKLIIELKDKLMFTDVFPVDDGGDFIPAGSGIHTEVVQALIALGYGNSESYKAVNQVDVTDKSVEEVLKEALRNI